MQPQGTAAFNPAYFNSITAQINGIANNIAAQTSAVTSDINALDPCATVQAIITEATASIQDVVDQAMAEVQTDINAIESQIAALAPIIAIPGANLGAIVGWITQFVGPSILASANYLKQLEQIASAVSTLTTAIEAAAASLNAEIALIEQYALPPISLTISTPTISIALPPV
jgi:hypothetical protein